MQVERDKDGRRLQPGDPVTLVGGLSGRQHRGVRSHATVVRFGSKYVYVRIEDSFSHSLIGTEQSVSGDNLVYGHTGYVRQADWVADIPEQLKALIESGEQYRALTVLLEVVDLGINRGIITGEQGRELWMLWDKAEHGPDGSASAAR